MLWYKLCGINELLIKLVVNFVSGIVFVVKCDGYEWVLIDMLLNFLVVVDDVIRNVMMVIILVCFGVFDVNVV